MEFLLSSRRLNNEYHTPDYLRPFLWRELFHNCNLCIRTPLFDGFDEIMTSRCERDALYPPESKDPLYEVALRVKTLAGC